MSAEKLLRLPEVLERTGFSKSGLYAAIKDGRFAAPLKLSRRAVAWEESQVSAFIDQRIAAGRGQHA